MVIVPDIAVIQIVDNATHVDTIQAVQLQRTRRTHCPEC